MTERRSRLAFYPVLVLVYAILLIPVAIVILSAFTQQQAPTIPYDGVTLEWFVTLFENDRMIDAIMVSTTVGIATALVSGVIGTITAFGIVRSDIWGKETIATVLLLPIMISPVITGLAFLQFGSLVSIPKGFTRLVLTHSVLAFPFVFLIVRARLMSFDERLEDASVVMGANRLETALNVSLPIIAPATIAGMLIAFVISFGEFTASQFLVTPDTTTVPIIIFNQIKTGLSPEISALATVLVIIMVIVSVAGDVIS